MEYERILVIFRSFFMDINKFHQQLFGKAGPPSDASLLRLKKLKDNCVDRTDPNCFYMVFDVRPEPSIVWHHNFDAVFGLEEISPEGYANLIHPEWRLIYTAFTIVSYRLTKGAARPHLPKGITYSVNIPMKHKTEGYQWYKQLASAMVFDDKGNLVQFFNQYYRLGAYEKLLPSTPEITLEGKETSMFDDDVMALCKDMITPFLRKTFSPSCLKILTAYRQGVDEKKEWVMPSKSEVAKELGLSSVALDRSIVRLLKSARTIFPAHAVPNMRALSTLLNSLLGLPL
ncbi:MAG: hypothetical protein ACJAZ9_000831 [Neolewinella sp.]